MYFPAGTLDPTLQDIDGKPKRDISTILHILNDLLVASPQFRNQSVCTRHQHQQPTHLHPTNIGEFSASSGYTLDPNP